MHVDFEGGRPITTIAEVSHLAYGTHCRLACGLMSASFISAAAQHLEILIMRQADIMDQVRMIIIDASIEASPENYEICHRIVTRSDPDVVRQAEMAIAQAGRIDAAAFQVILDSAAPPRGQIDAAKHMAVLDAELEKMLAASRDARTGSGSFATALEGAAKELSALQLGSGTEMIVSHLIIQTVTMAKKAAALEASLTRSSAELDGLRNDLDRARIESGSDVLTSLPNRRAFDARLADAIAVAQASREPLSLAFCDIDHFKRFNDTWGHKLGDQVLRLVGSQLARMFGGIGLPARYGGEEFVVLLPRHGSADALAALKAFCDTIRGRTIRTRSDSCEVGKITLSAGVATLRRGEAADAFVERADQAMYEAKRQGRDQVISSV